MLLRGYNAVCFSSLEILPEYLKKPPIFECSKFIENQFKKALSLFLQLKKIEVNVPDCDDSVFDSKNECKAFDKDDPCANKDLRNKKVSNEVKVKINSRRTTRPINGEGSPATVTIPEFRIQDVEDGVGRINLDRYELNITKLPTGLSPQDLFKTIRLNMTQFASGDESFLGAVEFEAYSLEDNRKWNSNNPIGAAMNFNTLADTATVIATEFSASEMFWTFTTVHSADHFGHPVSGHRQFGLKTNEDGSYSFYLRGSDRLTTNVDAVANFSLGLTNFKALVRELRTGLPVASLPRKDFAFDLADTTWKVFMKNLEDFIISKGGTTIPFDKNKSMVKDMNINKEIVNENYN